MGLNYSEIAPTGRPTCEDEEIVGEGYVLNPFVRAVHVGSGAHGADAKNVRAGQSNSGTPPSGDRQETTRE